MEYLNLSIVLLQLNKWEEFSGAELFVLDCDSEVFAVLEEVEAASFLVDEDADDCALFKCDCACVN